MKKNEREREDLSLKKKTIEGWRERGQPPVNESESFALERSGMHRRQWLELLSSEKLEGRKCIVCVCGYVCVCVCVCGGRRKRGGEENYWISTAINRSKRREKHTYGERISDCCGQNTSLNLLKPSKYLERLRYCGE